MIRRLALCGLAAAAGGLGALVPAALADEQVTAAAPYRFTTPAVTIDQGERLTFRNTDVAGHDVTARLSGPDGKPLFATPLIANGETAFVEGSQYLTTGRYEFLCSVHPSMTGVLNVSAAGTPVPRPVAGVPVAPDTTRPSVAVRVVSRRLAVVRRQRALVASVRVNEKARVSLRAVSRPRPGGPLVTVARGSVSLPAAGTRRVTMRLTAAGRRALRGGRRRLAVLLTARAVDAAGNATRRTTGRTIGV
jgi:plastocyanin